MRDASSTTEILTEQVKKLSVCMNQLGVMAVNGIDVLTNLNVKLKEAGDRRIV